MRNTRNKRKLAELQDNFDEDLSQGSSRERSNTDPNENYITQVSQEIEGRISKKLSQEFSKRESRILGALAKLDHFLSSSVNSACISTPNPKLTSVTGNQDLSPSDCQEREGHSLNGQQDRNRIPDPDEACCSCGCNLSPNGSPAKQRQCRASSFVNRSGKFSNLLEN